MSTLKTSPSLSPGKKKPYFKVREKRTLSKEMFKDYFNDKSGDVSRSKGTSASQSTKGTLTTKLNDRHYEDLETVSSIQKNLQKKFYSNMIESSASKSPPKTSKTSSDMKLISRINTESETNQSKHLSINPNLSSTVTTIVSPKSQINFNSRTPVTDQDFMKSLTPRYVINSIYSYNYLSRKSPNKEREKMFSTYSQSPTHSAANSQRTLPPKTSSRTGVFERLYEEKTVTTRYDNGAVLGVKDILQRAQDSLNRSQGRPSFDGINILTTEENDRKFSVQQYMQTVKSPEAEKLLDPKFARKKAATPDITSTVRSPQANGTVSTAYNFSFGGEARNYNRYTQQAKARIGLSNEKIGTANFGKNYSQAREFPPDPAELIYSSPKSNEKPAHQPKYFQNSKGSGQKENPAFNYVSGRADSQYYRQPAPKK